MQFIKLITLLAFFVCPKIVHAAFPSAAAYGTDSAGTSCSATCSINMPASISAGNLLMVFCTHDSATLLAQSGGSDWTRLETGLLPSSVESWASFAKIAAGSDTLTLAGAAQDYACGSVRVTGHGVTNVSVDIMRGTAATGTSANPNPPTVTHGGPQDYLVFSLGHAEDDDNQATPCGTNYSLGNQIESAQSNSSVMTTICTRSVNGTSEDPPAQTNSASDVWSAQTYSIPPVLATQYTKFTDTFSQADENPLSSSGVWDHGYTSRVDNQVVGNRVRDSTLDSQALGTVNSVSLTNDQWARLTISTMGGAVNASTRLFLRAASPATVTHYEFRISKNTSQSRIGLFNGGALTILATETATTWAATDQLQAIAVGTRLTLQRKVSGGSFISLVTAVDGTVASGRAGLGTFVAVSGSLADMEVDDYEAGDFTAPAGSCAGTRLLVGMGC